MGESHRIGADKGVASENNIERLREQRGWKRPELARRMETSTQQLERLEKGQRRLTTDWIDKAAAALGVSPGHIIGATPDALLQPPTLPAIDDADQPLMVDIQHIDLAYGLGATFADGAVQVDLLQFPKVWVDSITTSPPALLTWTQARGDSMEPTISDGDLVLLDRSQRKPFEQDAMWAFTVGDTASIKRLRLKGARYEIHSDNPSVKPDEEPIELVHIVARVIFVGKRK